ncbi:MAG: hypothetical protein WAO83_20950 [Fuerstiella sp.]
MSRSTLRQIAAKMRTLPERSNGKFPNFMFAKSASTLDISGETWMDVVATHAGL